MGVFADGCVSQNPSATGAPNWWSPAATRCCVISGGSPSVEVEVYFLRNLSIESDLSHWAQVNDQHYDCQSPIIEEVPAGPDGLRTLVSDEDHGGVASGR